MLLQETITAEYDLIGSFYEIYNNQVYDLINPGKRLDEIGFDWLFNELLLQIIRSRRW